MYIYMYDILLIHPSVNGHLGYFHVLAIVTSAAMNMVHKHLFGSSSFSTSSLTLIVFRFSDSSHPNRCEVVSHCGFDLHLSND